MTRLSAPPAASKSQAMAATWDALSLAQKFASAAIVVISCGMIALGAWVSRQIEDGVIQNAAASTALYTDSFVEPLAQELTRRPTLSPTALTRLDGLLTDTALGRRVVEVKIWDHDGRVVYSRNAALIGQQFGISTALRDALNGRIVGEFDDFEGEDNSPERRLGVPLLEIYSPIRERGGDRVIAVVELYEIGDRLRADLASVRWRTWVVVATLSFCMIGLLFGIVRRGSDTIQRQRRSLEARVLELQCLLEENRELRASVDLAHRRAAETTDQFMRRVGIELHDGPAQLLGLALMHLEDLDPDGDHIGEVDMAKVVEKLEELIESSIAEIRQLAVGLAAPELEGLSLADALRLAAKNHTWRTGAEVDCQIDALPTQASPLIKSCVYRFAQEGLINGFKHGGGIGQSIRARSDAHRLMIEVADAGPGMAAKAAPPERPALGLSGMRHRIESLGGRFELESAPGAGTRLQASFEMSSGELLDGGNTHSGH